MFKISELVKLIDGEYKGEISEIVGLAPFESAKENEITFAVDEKFLKNLDKTKAKLVIVPPIQGLPTSKEYIYVNKSPRELMPLILNFFKRKTKVFIKNIEDSSKIFFANNGLDVVKSMRIQSFLALAIIPLELK